MPSAQEDFARCLDLSEAVGGARAMSDDKRKYRRGSA